MATIAKKTAPAATTAKKAAPAAAPAKPVAPRYVMGPWPAKSRGGNSIRAYCYSVAAKLSDDNKGKGFTLAELASAFAANAKGSDMKQPGTGWGTPDKPNGAAMQHANWFAHDKQGWLTKV